MKFERAFVTGAGRGLGREIVLCLRPFCANLVLLGRDRTALEALKTELKDFGGEIDIIVADLSKDADVEAAAAYSKRVDLLVNNAGLGFLNRFEAQTERELSQMMTVNMNALTRLTHTFGKRMLTDGGGQILNVASVAAFLPVPYFSVYAATKSYVLSLSRALDEEFRGRGVRVKALCPGGIATDFHRGAGMTDQILKDNARVISAPDVIAKAAVELIQSSCERKTPGAPNRLLSFIAWALPGTWVTRIAGKSYEKYLPS